MARHVVRLGDHFCAENTTLISHLIGIAGMTVSLDALGAILADSRLSEDAARAVGRALRELEEQHIGIAEGYRMEGLLTLSALRMIADDPRLADLDALESPEDRERAQSFLDSMKDWDALEAEHLYLWTALVAVIEKPHWERETIDDAWVEQRVQNPLLRIAIPNASEAAVRQDHAMTQLRLCMVLCALRVGSADYAGQIMDPFTGEPLHIADDRVWSLGPDGADQEGRMRYDPSNGSVSAGDIVAAR